MDPDNQSQGKSRYDYTSLFVAAMLLMTTSQGIESIETPAGHFIRGVAIGMSIACSLIGMVLYVQSGKKSCKKS